MTMLEKSRRLVELRQALAKFKAHYQETVDPLTTEKQRLEEEILQDFRESGQFSARFEFGTVTRAVRKTLKVEDETKVVAYLKKQKLDKEYVEPRLRDIFYDSFLKEAARQEMEIPGVALTQVEYVSISQGKQGDKRKVAVD